MNLETNQKRYNELLADYNAKYNDMVKVLQETSTPEYMVNHLAKSFLVKESFELDILKATIQTQKDLIVFESRYGKK